MSALDKQRLITDQPGRSIACCHNCGWQCCIWAIAFPYLLSITLLAYPWQSKPGNEMRKEIEGEVLKALQTDTWTDVSKRYLDTNTASSVLMIGDFTTGRRWKKADGRKEAENYPMGSQTKFITALTIYKIMQDSTNGFNWDTPVHRAVPGWPMTGFAGEAKMRHLLSMTTGFVADVFYPGCVANLDPPKGQTEAERWFECMNEIGHYEFRYKPGTMFHYGPWHLFVATGGALIAAGQPLTKTAWKNQVNQVYQLAGLSSQPDFPADPKLPDVSHGMEMSANEWNAIIAALTNQQILTGAFFQMFMADHSTQVTKVWADSPAYEMWWYREMRADQALSGGWHYSQGHWIVCNALATKDAQDKYIAGDRYTWQQMNEQCGNGNVENYVYANARHDVHHSMGEHGAFIWIDAENNYYGIYMQYFNWPLWLFWGAICIGLASSCCCLVSCMIGAQVNYNKMRQAQLGLD